MRPVQICHSPLRTRIDRTVQGRLRFGVGARTEWNEPRRRESLYRMASRPWCCDCVALDAPGKLAEEDYTLQLCAKPGTLAQAADEQFFGQDDDGVWRRSAGMDAPSPVSWMFGPGWSAMVATQTCGVSDAETGFHAAGGTCLMFAGSDGHWALVADSEGFWQDFALGDAILRSIRFAPPPPAR